MADTQAHLIDGGVAFTVSVDFINHDCVVLSDALSKLSEMGGGQADPMQTYRAYEANINGVARRMVAAGVPGTPLRLSAKNFPSTQRGV